MTVNYMREAATVHVGTFLKLLFRWRGSVWKIIWKELNIYLFIYFNICVGYQFLIKGSDFGPAFERLSRYCRTLMRDASTVLTFALGFYVSQIADRWWKVFMTIPWPDTFGLQTCAFLRSRTSEEGSKTDRMIRKTAMRYVILTYVLVFRDISERIRRRFPTYDHLVPTLLTEAEKVRLENEDLKRVYWMPLEWATQLLMKCYKRGQIDEHHYGVLCETMMTYRQMMHNLLSFDWVNVPLVYTQVVHICTIAYFGIACLANQNVPPDSGSRDNRSWMDEFVLPLYTIYEFVLFVGWLKVAQVMLNPFGMDEDDFEIDMLVDRNLQIGYSYVDSLYDKLPPLVLVDVSALPHTRASMALIKQSNPMMGSVANIQVPENLQQVISKQDVEQIRKLVGPRFGRRADYQQSKIDSDASKIENLDKPKQTFYVDNEDEVEAVLMKAPAGSRESSASAHAKGSGSHEKNLIANAVERLKGKVVKATTEEPHSYSTEITQVASRESASPPPAKKKADKVQKDTTVSITQISKKPHTAPSTTQRSVAASMAATPSADKKDFKTKSVADTEGRKTKKKTPNPAKTQTTTTIGSAERTTGGGSPDGTLDRTPTSAASKTGPRKRSKSPTKEKENKAFSVSNAPIAKL
ncbi:hypothetical protein Q1695_010121 [Nippostrongylus brasiliensis]|nr:hypothetical protein Q1695_010121 [Nippostrongylus brasiliensis]